MVLVTTISPCDVVLFLQPEQLTKIFELCGTPDDIIWPGVTKMPWYNNFKPPRPLKRRVKEFFKQWVIFDMFPKVWFQVLPLLLTLVYSCSFDRHALDLLEKMLTLDPSQVGYTCIKCEFYKNCYLVIHFCVFFLKKSFLWLVPTLFGYCLLSAHIIWIRFSCVNCSMF